MVPRYEPGEFCRILDCLELSQGASSIDATHIAQASRFLSLPYFLPNSVKVGYKYLPDDK